MIPFVIPGAVAVASMIGSIISQRNASKVAKRNTDLTIQANKELAKYQYEQEQKNIGELNKYNSPKSQMERFMEAGLNKNLIYTQGNAGNQTMIPKYNAPQINYAYEPNFLPDKAINSGVNAFQVATQIQNMITQGKIQKAEAVLKTALSNYADDIALSSARKSFNEALALKFKRVFQEEEFNRFFRYDQQNNMYYLKEGMEETFVNNLASKWLKPSTDLAKTQTDIESRNVSISLQKQMLENLKFIPWLQPIIGFLKLLK